MAHRRLLQEVWRLSSLSSTAARSLQASAIGLPALQQSQAAWQVPSLLRQLRSSAADAAAEQQVRPLGAPLDASGLGRGQAGAAARLLPALPLAPLVSCSHTLAITTLLCRAAECRRVRASVLRPEAGSIGSHPNTGLAPGGAATARQAGLRLASRASTCRSTGSSRWWWGAAGRGRHITTCRPCGRRRAAAGGNLQDGWGCW